LRGRLTFRWLKTFLATVGGSLLSYLCGIPVGSEGPAVLLGTSLGKACSYSDKSQNICDRYVMTGGAGAGFAVATGAPFSAILFAMEELHKRFTPVLLMTVSATVLSATFVNRLLCSAFSVDPALLHLPELSSFGLKNAGMLLLLGLLVAFAVAVFDRAVLMLGRLSQRFGKVFNPAVKLIVVFVITGILAFVLRDGVFSGHHTIIGAAQNEYTTAMLALLVLVRLFMMMLVTESGATGGIFIPTLAIGALAGALSARLLVAVGLPPHLYGTVVVLGMCAFIGGTLRAPLTSAVLFVELTGQFSDLFFVAVVVFTVNIVTELLDQMPFYDFALEKMEEAQNHGKPLVIAYFEMIVEEHSFAAGKPVRNILWPASTTVHSITPADTEHPQLDRDGEYRLHPGDKIILRLSYYDRQAILEELTDLVGSRVKEISL
jgi:H+/Cl- antiporter ClcA